MGFSLIQWVGKSANNSAGSSNARLGVEADSSAAREAT
jgi:hypothetical protein